MGTGQTLLTIIAMMMLSRMAISVNRSNSGGGSSVEMAAYRITAVSIGTSLIEEATGLAFDSKSDTVGISTPTNFTAPGSLGPDGAIYPHYNDFDDFNCFSHWDTLPGSAIFHDTANVDYVTISGNVISHSASQTYNKRIIVKVSSKWMKDTLTFTTVDSYWFFR